MFASSMIQIALGTTSLLASIISPVAASPYALPMPLAKLDFPRSFSSASIDAKAQPNTSFDVARAAMPYPVDINHMEPREDFSDLISRLLTSSSQFGALSQQASSVQANDVQYQQQAVDSLASLESLLQETHAVLAPYTAKGLANYDKDVPFETALKDIVNVSKATLLAIYKITNALPILGPLLGPSVYALKCVLEDILDILENITDGVLNPFKSLLVATIKAYGLFACGPGALDLGIMCLNLNLDLGSGGLLPGL